jgi:hypothetical protein
MTGFYQLKPSKSKWKRREAANKDEEDRAITKYNNNNSGKKIGLYKQRSRSYPKLVKEFQIY